MTSRVGGIDSSLFAAGLLAPSAEASYAERCVIPGSSNAPPTAAPHCVSSTSWQLRRPCRSLPASGKLRPLHHQRCVSSRPHFGPSSGSAGCASTSRPPIPCASPSRMRASASRPPSSWAPMQPQQHTAHLECWRPRPRRHPRRSVSCQSGSNIRGAWARSPGSLMSRPTMSACRTGEAGDRVIGLSGLTRTRGPVVRPTPSLCQRRSSQATRSVPTIRRETERSVLAAMLRPDPALIVGCKEAAPVSSCAFCCPVNEFGLAVLNKSNAAASSVSMIAPGDPAARFSIAAMD